MAVFEEIVLALLGDVHDFYTQFLSLSYLSMYSFLSSCSFSSCFFCLLLCLLFIEIWDLCILSLSPCATFYPILFYVSRWFFVLLLYFFLCFFSVELSITSPWDHRMGRLFLFFFSKMFLFFLHIENRQLREYLQTSTTPGCLQQKHRLVVARL